MRSTFLDCKADKGLGGDLYLKGAEKNLYLKFSQLNALRKVRSGTWSQKETCLKFNQAEGNVKVFWSLNIYSLNENVSLLLQTPVPVLLQLSYISYCLCRLLQLILVIFFPDRTEVSCFLILQSVNDMYDGIH